MTKAQAKENPHKAVIGLAGAIGSGKSTVAGELAKLGCAVIDADVLNHEILQETPVREQLQQWWGRAITDEHGQIDREALGRIVFNDPSQLKKLTDLVHPLIERRQAQLMAEYQGNPGIKAIVLDIPLLFEVGQNRLCDAVVFVQVDENLRTERLGKRGSDPEQTKKAENLQFALDMKAKMSDYKVQNNSSIPCLAMQIARLLSALMQENNP